jgi:dienelactone hydrolase
VSSAPPDAGRSLGHGANYDDQPNYYEHLGRYSDWAQFARWQASPGRSPVAPLSPALVRQSLGFVKDQDPIDPRVERTWQGDGVDGEEVSWSVGYGPRTVAWALRPAGARGALPGVLALHDHGDFKFYGKEKIADGPEAPDQSVVELRERHYGGRAFANELARQGFAVLVHDTFLWGSRRFEVGEMAPQADPPPEVGSPSKEKATGGADDSGRTRAESIEIYNTMAATHEHVVAKYCTLLRTSLAGVVAYEDRVALQYLKGHAGVISERLGCIGLSGGGCRAALLQATSPDISASVVVGMMSTYDQLLDRHVACHTWMLFPPGLMSLGDWPDLASCRAPSPLAVQYCRDDELFSLEGMAQAHERITAAYSAAGAPHNYVGEFYDGGHQFDRAMQSAAFAHLARWSSE